jgi:hypothetical protein
MLSGNRIPARILLLTSAGFMLALVGLKCSVEAPTDTPESSRLIRRERSIPPKEQRAMEVEFELAITGRVWNDYDVDGVRDAGESGLPGVLVSLSVGGDTIKTAETDPTGDYSFTVSSPGTYRLTETDPYGWVSSQAVPGSPEVTKVDANNLDVEIGLSRLFEGTDLGGNDFGDVEANVDIMSIEGRVWEDRNANGAVDAGELGLAGVWVELETGMGVYSSSGGEFALYGPKSTVQVLSAVEFPEGSLPTNAVPGDGAWKISNTSIGIDGSGLPNSGPHECPVSAGNLFLVHVPAPANITGRVFWDENRNGQLDWGEAGLPDVTLNVVELLTESGDSLTGSVITDAGGDYEITVNAHLVNMVRITSLGPGGDFFPTTSETGLLGITHAGDIDGHNFGYDQ